MPSSERVPSTLMTIAFDLQVEICTFLHPSDILSLRKACKALHFVTRQRIVWIEALYRVCRDNTLFIPSFPIPDMSDVELERAATAPHRWINLCAAFAEKQAISGTTLCGPNPKATRFIEPTARRHNFHSFLVPGGRYLLSHTFHYSLRRMEIWDLGYTPRAECKLLASIELECRLAKYMYSTTPDGMGLIIVLLVHHGPCHVYEIHPQSETPQFTLIRATHPPFYNAQDRVCLLPNKVVWYAPHCHRTDFAVWDYRLNHSISFSVNYGSHRIIATNIAILVFSTNAMLVWRIPSLSPQVLGCSDRDYPAQILPPLFTVPYPDDFRDVIYPLRRPTSWYSELPQPLYLDVFCDAGKFYGFEIVIKPDLSHVSLNGINTSRLNEHDSRDMSDSESWICDNTFITSWTLAEGRRCKIQIHIRATSSRPASAVPNPAGEPIFLSINLPSEITRCSLASCPVSGRFVYMAEDSNRLTVLDFLPDF